MEEEKKHEEHKEHAVHEEHKKSKLPFKLKLNKWDIISLFVLIIFVAIMAYLAFIPKDGCEVARPGYKCASLEDVMIENCVYWGTFDCDTQADVSLTQIEWYIGNLCNLQNKYHSTGLDCSNLQAACNQITGKQTC